MEEPDRDSANLDEKVVNDPLTASHSSEETDSWTLLGKGNDQQQNEPSGVQEIDKEDVAAEKGAGQTTSKQRHDSHRSTDSQLDESSDGISVISEIDTDSSDKMLTQEETLGDQGSTVHFSRNINLKLPVYAPLTPPYTPDEPKPARRETKETNTDLQIKRSDEQTVEAVNSMVEHSHPPVSNASWVIFSLIATGMVAVILGNSMRLQNRVEEVNFEHEKRISELELENNILKNEMNKLRHLYTRSELDEQVQRAEFEWRDVLNQDPAGETTEPLQDAEFGEETPAPPPMRKVPPQDGGVKRKVVWSGDEEEPMLIVDKDYVLPAFCYKQDQAVHDDLFSEYSAKYCDIKKRKIEAKQKKTEFQQKKQSKPENYNKFIHPKASEQSQEKRIDPGKPASPFNIDYQKAFDAIKAEGSVIVEALGSILDLSPEPEEIVKTSETPAPTDSPVLPDAEEVVSKCFENGCGEEPKKQRYEDHKQGKHWENEYDRKEDNSKKREEKVYNKQNEHNMRSTHEDGRKQKSDSREEIRQYDNKERKKEHWEKNKYEHKEQEKQYNKQKENNIRSAHEDGRKQKSDSREEIRHYDSKEGKKEYREKDKHDHKRKADYHSDDKYRKNYHHDDDDDDDDHHHKKKYKQREEFKERDYKGQPHRGDQRHGSGERPKQAAYDSGEGSYLDEYKRTEWTNGDRRRDDHQHYDKHHKKHDRDQRQQRADGDWNEKRYKGRDEYRQNGGKHGERGSGEQHWQERMKNGRQAARDEQRQQMERESNWYLERGNQREEDRMFSQPDSQTR
ncbi:zinc finger CCCH domain-containing protein 13-like [Anopheles funestus]|uniref:zinc finger CCCH domain-containing protein 13-like n=1 Tax=Anopheles funestus TaxID=62324 RepID=UPI0020C73B8C|nr:zinc finger CCCH domain-containing protein 13-like [Anopheles funestus]XP_049281383.1 zinc finger CCCH domain-containing protein 13-like [Anopheles funestus]